MPYRYALIKIREYYNKNNISHYDDKYEQKYIITRNKILEKLGLEKYDGEYYEFTQERKEDSEKYDKWLKNNREEYEKILYETKKELYKDEFKMFKESLNEKVEGKYFLKDKYGNIIEFIKETKYGYRYRSHNELKEKLMMDYMTAVIRKNIMGNDITIRNLDHPLVSEYLDEQIKKYPLNSQSKNIEGAKVFIKYHDLDNDKIWFIIEGDKEENDYILYGYVVSDNNKENIKPELSYVYLSELEKNNIEEIIPSFENTLGKLSRIYKMPLPNESKQEELEVS